MATYEEVTYISEFNIQPTGCIGVRKSTNVLKDGEIISTTYWRTTLLPNDTQAAEVLNEPYYLNIANYAWSQVAPQPYPPPTPGP